MVMVMTTGLMLSSFYSHYTVTYNIDHGGGADDDEVPRIIGYLVSFSPQKN